MPRWISLAGLEFGTLLRGFSNANPGKLGQDFFLSGKQSFEKLAAMGFQSVRIPFRWERLQPELNGALSPDGVQALRHQLSLARAAGVSVMIDLHNYGRYSREQDGKVEELKLGEQLGGAVPLGAAELSDFWSRMSRAFRGQPNLIGYGLMNEPHDLPPGAWVEASAAAAQAIRAGGDSARLFVAGNRWSSAAHWERVNPATPWIEDSLNKVSYEAHCYLDQNGSGEYALDYQEELDFDPNLAARAATRLKPFLRWLEENEAEGFLGEFAVPTGDARWLPLLRDMVARLDAAKVTTAWWAAGEHWGDYPLALEPRRSREAPHPIEYELFGS
jgi:endoglucanase